VSRQDAPARGLKARIWAPRMSSAVRELRPRTGLGTDHAWCSVERSSSRAVKKVRLFCARGHFFRSSASRTRTPHAPPSLDHCPATGSSSIPSPARTSTASPPAAQAQPPPTTTYFITTADLDTAAQPTAPAQQTTPMMRETSPPLMLSAATPSPTPWTPGSPSASSAPRSASSHLAMPKKEPNDDDAVRPPQLQPGKGPLPTLPKGAARYDTR
jgi:hypothetical protein